MTEFPMEVTLQGHAKPRGEGEMGAYNFQRWLQECRARGYKVLVAQDDSHAIAVDPKAKP